MVDTFRQILFAPKAIAAAVRIRSLAQLVGQMAEAGEYSYGTLPNGAESDDGTVKEVGKRQCESERFASSG